MKMRLAIVLVCFTFVLVGSLAEECGTQAGGKWCPEGSCCSQYGWCGSTYDYCCETKNCQTQCWQCLSNGSIGDGGDLGSIISRDTFNQMLKHRNDGACPARGFYTYDAFITAAKAFPNFGNIGDNSTKKREIAAFFGQTSHETTGGWPSAPDGPYAWGYCFVKEQNSSTYCASSAEFPCAAGKQYYGRGPIQISWNYNYGQCGRAIGVDLLNNPDLVATDPVISFKCAIWFWMTSQSPKPSCNDVITGRWSPSNGDLAEGRLPGYGTVTNIINGGLECGRVQDSRVQDRIGFYKRYCDLFGIGYDDNLDCAAQSPFGSSLLLLKTV